MHVSDDAMLRVESVTVRYGGITAVDHVDLVVRPGEVVGLIGPNGAGKSTLLDAVSGFAPHADGRVVVDGRDVTRMLPYQRARAGVARSFQDARLYPSLTVRDVLMSARHERHRNGLFAEGFGLPDARREERTTSAAVDALMDVVDVRRYLDHLVGELSFGTARAVELAWLAARRPRLMLLDEPASGLQQSEVRVLAALIDRIRADAAVVVVDHDVPFVRSLAHRIVAMDLGRVIADGAAADVLRDPSVVRSYLGDGRYAGSSAASREPASGARR
jgi:ABC-type branched-subunit amino acid transport system ATPase component